MAQDNENKPNEGLETALNSILSDPQSMSRLASMASALASSGVLSGLVGSLSGGEETEGRSSSEAHAETNEESAPTVAVIHEKTPSVRGVSGRHTALLRAIKPYLGTEKQARVDRMVKLLQLAELADTVLRDSREVE